MLLRFNLTYNLSNINTIKSAGIKFVSSNLYMYLLLVIKN